MKSKDILPNNDAVLKALRAKQKGMDEAEELSGDGKIEDYVDVKVS